MTFRGQSSERTERFKLLFVVLVCTMYVLLLLWLLLFAIDTVDKAWSYATVWHVRPLVYMMMCFCVHLGGCEREGEKKRKVMGENVPLYAQ